jgi:hypothetical protein
MGLPLKTRIGSENIDLEPGHTGGVLFEQLTIADSAWQPVLMLILGTFSIEDWSADLRS